MAGNPTTRWPWLTRERLALTGLLLFTLLVRSGVLYALRGNLQQDPDAYREIAENLLKYGVFALGERDPHVYRTDQLPEPTAYRPPLYPVLLSNLRAPLAKGHAVSLAKVALVHLLLGLATVWLTWLTARQIQISDFRFRIANENPSTTADEPGPLWTPLLAGLLVACDPILLNQSTLVMTETLATFLAVLSLWCLARFDTQRAWFNAALAGGAIGLAMLCRPTFLPWLALVAAGMLAVPGRISDFRFQISNLGKAAKRQPWWPDVRWRVANVVCLLLAACVVVSPWAFRNYRVFGKPIVATTHGGYTLWLGNNSSFYEWLRNDKSGLPWDVKQASKYPSIEDLNRQFELLSAGELAVDSVDHDRALSTIASDPSGFARASLYRITQLWFPLPNKLTADESTNRRLLRYATAAWYCGVYLLATVGIWKLRWRLLASPWIWGVLLCVAFTAVHTFYWSNLRMRAPLMPFVAIVAAAALLPRGVAVGTDGARRA